MPAWRRRGGGSAARERPTPGAAGPPEPPAGEPAADREAPPAALGRLVLRGAALSGAGFASRQVLSFATSLVLARLVTPKQFGVFATGMIIIEFGGTVAGSGMLAALIQRRDRLEEAANTALLATVGGGLAMAAAQAAASPLFGLYFHSSQVAEVAAVTSGMLLLSTGAIVPNALLQRRFSFVRRAVVEPATALTYGGVAIIACAAGLGTWGLVVGTYTSSVVAFSLTWILARWRPRPGLATVRMWRELARFARHIVASDALERTVLVAPAALLGRFSGQAAVGNFGYAFRMAILPRSAAIDVGSFVLLPAFAAIAEEAARLRAALVRSLRMLSVVAIPMSIILLPLGAPLVVVLFGSEWRPAGDALAALCLYSAGLALVDLALEAFKSTGRPAVITRMIAVRSVVAVALMVALVPFGLNGVAAALSIGAVLAGAYALWLMHRVLLVPLGDMLRVLWPPLAAAAVMAAALFALDRLALHAGDRGTLVGLVLLGVEGVLGGAVYLGALSVLSPRDARALARGVRRRVGGRRPGPVAGRRTTAESGGDLAPGSPARAGRAAETCVVRWGEGIVVSHFYAEARGPRGRYIVGRSATFAFDDAEPPQRSDIVAAHERLLARLAKRGWRLSGESGNGQWWERRLARGRAR
jgi:PST family polysaccharide transporter